MVATRHDFPVSLGPSSKSPYCRLRLASIGYGMAAIRVWVPSLRANDTSPPQTLPTLCPLSDCWVASPCSRQRSRPSLAHEMPALPVPLTNGKGHRALYADGLRARLHRTA